jgi:hypothetical protein
VFATPLKDRLVTPRTRPTTTCITNRYLENNQTEATDFYFGPSNLNYKADRPIPIIVPQPGVMSMDNHIVAAGATWTPTKQKGVVLLVGAAQAGLSSAPAHPLQYDRWRAPQPVRVTAAPYQRIDGEFCSILHIEGL